jgi:hypothetical protein
MSKDRFIFAGADLAFVRDSSALVLVRRTGAIFSVVAIVEKRPTRVRKLKPSEVYAEFAEVLKDNGVSEVVIDIHEQSNTAEQLEKLGIHIRKAPGGEAGKILMYTRMRTLLQEGRLKLPSVPRLVAQIKALVAKPISGGKMKIESPRRGGFSGHGDIVSALCCALWAAEKHGGKSSPASREFCAAESLRTAAMLRARGPGRAGWDIRVGNPGGHEMSGEDYARMNAASVPALLAGVPVGAPAPPIGGGLPAPTSGAGLLGMMGLGGPR